MTMKTFARSGSVAALAAALFLGACSQGRTGDDPTPGNDSGEVRFTINIPGNVSASSTHSRALSYVDEVDIESIDILVFTDGLYSYTAPMDVTSAPVPNSVSGGATLSLGVKLPTSGVRSDLMFVANGHEAITEALAGSIAAGSTQSEFLASLTVAMPSLTGWATGGISAGAKMPMWGYLADQLLDESYTGSDDVRLVRMLAKVDIRLADALVNTVDPSLSKFQMHNVRVYNYARVGLLAPDLGGSFDWADPTAPLTAYTTPSLPADYATKVKSAGADEYILRESSGDDLGPWQSLTGEIYLFEAPAGVAAPSPGYKTGPCLVVGGRYEGATEDTFYRVDFFDKSTGTYLPLLRNNSYSVSIVNITGPGHVTPEEAYNSVPATTRAGRPIDVRIL